MLSVEVPGEVPTPPTEVPFEITHQTLEYAPKRYGRQRRLRPFRVTGKLHDATISTSRPLTGEVVVEESERPIKVRLKFVGVIGGGGPGGREDGSGGGAGRGGLGWVG